MKKLFLCAILAAEFAVCGICEEKSAQDKKKDVLLYGIDSEIIELVKKLGEEKDSSLNEDLNSILLSTRSPKMKESILQFFSKLEWPGAEDSAQLILEGRMDESESAVISALQYLSAVKSSKGIEAARAILAEDENKFVSSAIRFVGRSGTEADEDTLLSYLGREDLAESLKQETILALGNIASKKAADKLMEILDDAEANKVSRAYAADSLGKIKDEKAVPILVKAANSEDSTLRTYAVSALANFDQAEARSMLIQAFKDSYYKVRIQAALSAGKLKLEEARSFLEYKIRNDPEKTVKSESLKALAELGGPSAFEFIRGIVGEKFGNAAMKQLGFSLLLKYDASSSWDSILSALKEAAKEPAPAFLQALAGEAARSDSKDPKMEELAGILMESPDYVVRLSGIEWARRNKAQGLKAKIEELQKDKLEAVRKKAKEAGESF